MDKKKITIETVAKLAGVSIKTVSRVLNSESSVREKTRLKVQQAIDELDYKPSPAAQALASSQSRIIGLIYENVSASYILRMQNGALKACYENDYNLVIHPYAHGLQNLADELLDLVKRTRLDGLILIPPISDDLQVIETLVENNILFVRIAPAEEINTICSISSNDADAVEKIISHLIQQGHSQIGLIKGHDFHAATQLRLQGYQNALKAGGLEIKNELICAGDFSFEAGKKFATELLNRQPRPTAIFACNDYMAAGVMYVANEMNIKVPEDLSIVGFDNAPVSRQIAPMITTVKQPIEEMAEAAACMLIQLCRKSDIEDKHLIFAAEVLLRESHKAVSR